MNMILSRLVALAMAAPLALTSCGTAPESVFDYDEFDMDSAWAPYRVAEPDPDADARAARLARVESLLQSDRLDEAAELLAAARADGDSVRTRELTARLALRRGQFDAATRGFATLIEEASSPLVRSSLQDLRALSEGLAAWAEARFGDANESWDRIQSDALRRSLERAREIANDPDTTETL